MNERATSGVGPFDAILLAGGRGKRLGGADKAALVVGGERLLERAVGALGAAGAARIVVVGPRRSLEADVVWVREEPAYGGPAAAIARGLAEVTSPIVVVLAVDMPAVTGAVVTRVVDALDGGRGDAAMLVGFDGRPQFLAAAYRTTALRAALDRLDAVEGAAMHALVADMDIDAVFAEDAVRDIDTPDDL